MKKLILICSMALLPLFSFADEHWQDKWAESATLLEKGEFEIAKPLLDEAIALMEDEGDEAPYLYVDRARLNVILGHKCCSIKDLEKALQNDQLVKQERIRAITTKIFVNGSRKNYETLFDDLKLFQEISDLPLFAMKGKKVIMRNIPKNEYYKKILTCYLVHAGISYDKDELSWLKSDMLVGETHCGCPMCKAEYAKTRECDACTCTISPTKQNCSLESFLQAFIQYCGNHIKQLDDQVACLKAACQMQAGQLAIELFPDTFDNILKVDASTPIYWD